jgi:hypothetical protein
LETLNIYFDSRHSTVPTINHPEKSSSRGGNNGTATNPGTQPAPAINGEQTQV